MLRARVTESAVPGERITGEYAHSGHGLHGQSAVRRAGRVLQSHVPVPGQHDQHVGANVPCRPSVQCALCRTAVCAADLVQRRVELVHRMPADNDAHTKRVFTRVQGRQSSHWGQGMSDKGGEDRRRVRRERAVFDGLRSVRQEQMPVHRGRNSEGRRDRVHGGTRMPAPTRAVRQRSRCRVAMQHTAVSTDESG